MQWYSDQLTLIAEMVQSKIKTIVPMDVDIPKGISDGVTSCHICEKIFTEKDTIVREHCHFTGSLSGYAYQACNLNYRKLFVVPVVFHNLSGYDSHFMIRELSKKGNMSVLPVNKEKYISFTLQDQETNIKFRFIDSLRFLGASLDKFASIMERQGGEILSREFNDTDEAKFTLLTRKGIFPYDYIDCLEKFNETKLLTKEAFYNKLNDENITDEQYQHAQDVWTTFEISDLGTYSDLYLKTDVLLLADVFENFRKKFYATYSLDVAWYYTLPGYTFSVMLK